jgi:hypothetical protein
VTLLSNAFKAGIPEQAATSASFELFRLAANLCMDHGMSYISCLTLKVETKRLLDPNRQKFLDTKFHDVTLSILKRYIALPNPTNGDLKVAKTAIGALLNSCFSFGT